LSSTGFKALAARSAPVFSKPQLPQPSHLYGPVFASDQYSAVALFRSAVFSAPKGKATEFFQNISLAFGHDVIA
jgi:hypothetical protein